MNNPEKRPKAEAAMGISEDSPILSLFPSIVCEATSGIGLPNAQVDENLNPLDHNIVLASWCCIYGLQSHLWMDIVVEAQRDHLLKTFKEVTHTTDGTAVNARISLSDSYDLLGEIANFIRGGIRHQMTLLEDHSIAPGTPKEVPGGNLATIRDYRCFKTIAHVKAEEIRLKATLLIQQKHPQPCSLSRLTPMDISMESIPTDTGLEVLAKGVVLSKRWIEKLQKRYLNEKEDRKMLVLKPPELVALFQPKFI